MPGTEQFILGEFERTVDDRYRVSLPGELTAPLTADSMECILAKERPGCLSLWSAPAWQTKLDEGVALVRQKMRAGRLEGKLAEVQRFGRLLSTRHKRVELAGKGRLLIPEGFREFLGVEPNGPVVVVGAAVCVELWSPPAWIEYLRARMPKFRRLFDQLSQ